MDILEMKFKVLILRHIRAQSIEIHGEDRAYQFVNDIDNLIDQMQNEIDRDK